MNERTRTIIVRRTANGVIRSFCFTYAHFRSTLSFFFFSKQHNARRLAFFFGHYLQRLILDFLPHKLKLLRKNSFLIGMCVAVGSTRVGHWNILCNNCVYILNWKLIVVKMKWKASKDTKRERKQVNTAFQLKRQWFLCVLLSNLSIENGTL